MIDALIAAITATGLTCDDQEPSNPHSTPYAVIYGGSGTPIGESRVLSGAALTTRVVWRIMAVGGSRDGAVMTAAKITKALDNQRIGGARCVVEYVSDPLPSQDPTVERWSSTIEVYQLTNP